MSSSTTPIDPAPSIPGTLADSELINVFGKEHLEFIHAVLARAQKLNLKIVTAESITAGKLCNRTLLFAGMPDMVDGIFVYTNQAKIRRLNVSAAVLEDEGPVAETTARQMAMGALAVTDADLSVAVTGFAGYENGKCYLAVGYRPKIERMDPTQSGTHHVIDVEELTFNTGNRTKDISTACLAAFTLLDHTMARIEANRKCLPTPARPRPLKLDTPIAYARENDMAKSLQLYGTAEDPELLRILNKDHLNVVNAILEKAHAMGLQLVVAESEATCGRLRNRLIMFKAPVGKTNLLPSDGVFTRTPQKMIERLNVAPVTVLGPMGDVNETTAREMATGALAESCANLSLAITGKPGVKGGKCYLAVAYRPKNALAPDWSGCFHVMATRELTYPDGDRTRDISQACVDGLKLMNDVLERIKFTETFRSPQHL